MYRRSLRRSGSRGEDSLADSLANGVNGRLEMTPTQA